MSANNPAIPPIRAGRGNDSETGVVRESVDEDVIIIPPCVVVVSRKWVIEFLLIE